MKILFVNNSPPCGVAEFGEQMHRAIPFGFQAAQYKADYPSYLPADAAGYDLIHINWHPGTLNHILPQHIPPGVKLSVYFHEATPAWEVTGYPDLWDRADVRFCQKAMKGAYYFPAPCPDPPSWVLAIKQPGVLTVGVSGLRGDGIDRLRPLCEKHGWQLSTSGPYWRSTDEEIFRLAQCHFNVAHYHTGAPGQSSSAMMMIASLRPLLINSNQLVENLMPYAVAGELPAQLYHDDELERGCEEIISAIRGGYVRLPTGLAAQRCWRVRIWDYVNLWKELL